MDLVAAVIVVAVAYSVLFPLSLALSMQCEDLEAAATPTAVAADCPPPMEPGIARMLDSIHVRFQVESLLLSSRVFF